MNGAHFTRLNHPIFTPGMNYFSLYLSEKPQLDNFFSLFFGGGLFFFFLTVSTLSVDIKEGSLRRKVLLKGFTVIESGTGVFVV